MGLMLQRYASSKLNETIVMIQVAPCCPDGLGVLFTVKGLKRFSNGTLAVTLGLDGNWASVLGAFIGDTIKA